MYPADDDEGTRGQEVSPAGGTIAMFYADQIPHEVLPSFRERHSFTVWYYDEDEHREATLRQGDAAAADSRAAHVPVTDIDGGGSNPGGGGGVGGCAGDDIGSQDVADGEAQAFVKMMMTENVGSERAVAAATALGPRALKTVATVFGAPTEETFLHALRGMSQADFDELRLEITSMGLENRPEAELA